MLLISSVEFLPSLSSLVCFVFCVLSDVFDSWCVACGVWRVVPPRSVDAPRVGHVFLCTPFAGASGHLSFSVYSRRVSSCRPASFLSPPWPRSGIVVWCFSLPHLCFEMTTLAAAENTYHNKPASSGSMRFEEPSALEQEFLEAAKTGNMGMLKYFAEQLNPSKIRDADGMTAFHFAAIGNSVEAMEFLVACGCDPMALDGRGGTCVLEAADAGSLEALQWLAEHGTPGCVNQPDARGDTALHVACGKGHVHLLDFLKHAGCDIERKTVDQQARPLQYAISAGRTKAVAWLIRNGVDLQANDNCFGWNALHIAAYNGRVDCVQLIADAWPDLLHTTARNIDEQKHARKEGAELTADQLAFRKGHKAVAKLIVKMRDAYVQKKSEMSRHQADAMAQALLDELDAEKDTSTAKKRKKKKKKRKKKAIVNEDSVDRALDQFLENESGQANHSDEAGSARSPTPPTAKTPASNRKLQAQKEPTPKAMWGDLASSDEESDEEAGTAPAFECAAKVDGGTQTDSCSRSPAPSPRRSPRRTPRRTPPRLSVAVGSPVGGAHASISNRSRSTDGGSAASSLDPRAPSWSPQRGRKWAGSLGEMSSDAVNAPHSRLQEPARPMTPEGLDAEFSRLLERYVHMDPNARAIARRQFAERILEGSDRVPKEDAAPQDVYSYTLHYPQDDEEKRIKRQQVKKLDKLRRMDDERRMQKKMRQLERDLERDTGLSPVKDPSANPLSSTIPRGRASSSSPTQSHSGSEGMDDEFTLVTKKKSKSKKKQRR